MSQSRSPRTIKLVESLARGGSIIELACGDGALLAALDPNAYSEFAGSDVSEVAIEAARERAKTLGVIKCTFSVCDMTAWEPSRKVALVVIEEALYYLKKSEQRNLLSKCLAAVAPRGHLLVIVHSQQRHWKTVEVCRSAGKVVDETVEGDRVYLILQG
jgi:trans-aconitate methyltransferase